MPSVAMAVATIRVETRVDLIDMAFLSVSLNPKFSSFRAFFVSNENGLPRAAVPRVPLSQRAALCRWLAPLEIDYRGIFNCDVDVKILRKGSGYDVHAR